LSRTGYIIFNIGKLHIELNPLAFIAEQAGGMATDGVNRILDLEPKELHQRSPVVIGSTNEVELFKNFAMNTGNVENLAV